MLATFVCIQVAAGLLLRGCWDLWAQSAVLLALIAGVAAWLLAGVVRGRVPLPSARPAFWALALCVLSFLSARLGPLPAYSLPAWAASTAGLGLIPAATLLSGGDRDRVERAVRLAAWALVLIAAYQRIHGQARPPSELLNQNVFAGAILLLLPFAARRGDAFLASGLLLCLWWTHSTGAWLALAAAIVLHRRAVGAGAFRAGAAAGFVALVVFAIKLQSPGLAHRWDWWAAAWRMAAAAPRLGFGPGAFAYALPAYVPARLELNTLFAHQYFLETAAERGGPYLLLWLGGLAVVLRRAAPGKRFGPVAALIHGLFDYPLSVPGVFWLFCLSVAWTLPESEAAAAVRSGFKRPAAALTLCLAACAAFWVERGWSADRLRATAVAASAAGAPPESVGRELERSEAERPHPETERLLAELALFRADGIDAPRFLNAAAGELERAVSSDPFRVSNWTMLENVYRRLGRPEDAANAHARGARTCPSLRAEAA